MPDPSTDAPGRRPRKRGASELAFGGAALALSVALMIVGPALQLPGLFFGGLGGLLAAVVSLAIGTVRHLNGHLSQHRHNLLIPAAIGAAVPIGLGLFMELSALGSG